MIQAEVEEVHVPVRVLVDGISKFQKHPHHRGVKPDLSHYLELILNLTSEFNSTYSFFGNSGEFYKSTP